MGAKKEMTQQEEKERGGTPGPGVCRLRAWLRARASSTPRQPQGTCRQCLWAGGSCIFWKQCPDRTGEPVSWQETSVHCQTGVRGILPYSPASLSAKVRAEGEFSCPPPPCCLTPVSLLALFTCIEKLLESRPPEEDTLVFLQCRPGSVKPWADSTWRKWKPTKMAAKPP